MEFFKKMGPRVILVEHQGKLVGLITIKDLLKYITRTEALDEEEEEFEVPGGTFGGRYRGGDLGSSGTSEHWWSSLSQHRGFSSAQSPRRSSAPNGYSHVHGVGTRRSPPTASSSPPVSSPHGKATQGTSISRPGRSASVSGMTMASSIGSFRDRIELTEQDHRDILFDHDEFDESEFAEGVHHHHDLQDNDDDDDENDFYDQDEGEVQLPSYERR
jgi:chloride channel 3/4/5